MAWRRCKPLPLPSRSSARRGRQADRRRSPHSPTAAGRPGCAAARAAPARHQAREKKTRPAGRAGQGAQSKSTRAQAAALAKVKGLCFARAGLEINTKVARNQLAEDPRAPGESQSAAQHSCIRPARHTALGWEATARFDCVCGSPLARGPLG
jgi:hypothetical protein